jgi:hypothetical protein
MPASYNIQFYQGDNYVLQFTIDGDYSAFTHKMDFATTLEAATATLSISGAAITATYDAGTLKTTCTATITAAQTADLDAEVIYYYDYQVVSGATSMTFLTGTASVYPQVTE